MATRYKRAVAADKLGPLITRWPSAGVSPQEAWYFADPQSVVSATLPPSAMRLGLTVLFATCAITGAGSQSAPPPATSGLDYGIYRDRVQPLFLDKRPGFARCYVCHSQGTPFRLQRLAEGAKAWTDEETRKNFQAVQRLVVAGKPEASRLLMMPLSHEAGGTEFHPGGKRWTSQDDPEWKELAQWIKSAAR